MERIESEKREKGKTEEWEEEKRETGELKKEKNVFNGHNLISKMYTIHMSNRFIDILKIKFYWI